MKRNRGALQEVKRTTRKTFTSRARDGSVPDSLLMQEITTKPQDVDITPKPMPSTYEERSDLQHVSTQSKHDPLEYLGGDEVALIISFLTPIETEVIRRVSRPWKAASECHNTGEALRRHYGNFGETTDGLLDRGAANLRFRRRLYHEMSLKNGTATKAYMYSDINKWDICNQRLLRTDSQNRIHVCELRNVRMEEQCIAKIDLAFVIGPVTGILNVRLSDLGDIIASVSIASDKLDETTQSVPEMHTSTEASGSGGKNSVDREDNIYQATTSTPLSDFQRQPDCYLIKLSYNGVVVWKVKQMACTSMRCSHCRSGVISKTHYFSFEHFRDESGAIIDNIMAFTSRNLTDGSIVMQTRLPQECSELFIQGDFGDILREHIPRNGSTMMLDDFASTERTIVFDTSTGHRVPFSRPPDGTMVFGAASDSIWVLGLDGNYPFHRGQHSFYDQATGKMHSSRLRFYKSNRYLESTTGIDMERQLMFRLLHSDIEPPETVNCLDQLTTLGISEVRETPALRGGAHESWSAIREQETMLMVTLPPRPKKARPNFATKNAVKGKSKAMTEAQAQKTKQQKKPPNSRRLLEVETSWEWSPFDFLGMSNDYLLHYIHETRTLVVVDFWPPW